MVGVGLVSFVAVSVVMTAMLVGEARSVVPIVRTPDGAATDAGRIHRQSLARLTSQAPRGVWVSVDTTGGRIRVHRANEVLREAACSAGSGVSLRDPRNGKVWTFRTPTGERSVIRKVKDPVWVKPDWAFIEEGFEPPPLGARDRRDDFSLGAFALHLGDGYMIHGTVFQSLVGRPVTHGCIRLRDEDLEYVFRTVPLGARVLLY
jgi:L,D-transpeptidase YbiS